MQCSSAEVLLYLANKPNPKASAYLQELLKMRSKLISSSNTWRWPISSNN